VKDRIQRILDNSQAVIFYWKAEEDWPVDYVSKNIELFGYSEDDFLTGRIPYGSIIYSEDAARVAEEVACYTEERVDQFRQVYRIVDGQGQVRWIDDRTVIERNESGQPAYYLGTIIDISEQKAAEDYNQILGQVVDQTASGVYIFQSEGLGLSYLNQAALNYTGYSNEQALKLSANDIHLDTGSETLESLLLPLQDALTDKVVFEAKQLDKAGVVSFVEVSVQSLERDGTLLYVAVIRDVSKRKSVERSKAQQHAFVQNILDGLVENVMVIRTDYSIEWMNQSAQEKADMNLAADAMHPKCYEISHHRTTPCNGVDHPCPLKEVQKTGQTVKVIHNHGNHKGDHFVELIAKPLRNERDEIYAIVESAHDITQMIKTQEVLKERVDTMSYDASHDGLTDLPNRRLFSDLCDQALLRAKRLSAMMAVAFIDVDKFKGINDSLGHEAGDEVLVEVAARLQSCVRVTDTVARYGGDEFTLLLEGIHLHDDIVLIMRKIMEAFKEDIETCAGNVRVTLSAGVAISPQDGSERKTLIRHADLALYDVKIKSRNDFRFYDQLD